MNRTLKIKANTIYSSASFFQMLGILPDAKALDYLDGHSKQHSGNDAFTSTRILKIML